MNIAFYLGGNDGPDVDARHPEDGNPGLGGTQYLMILLAHYLAMDLQYNVFVMARRHYELSLKGGGYINVQGDGDVVNLCGLHNVDILILRDHSDTLRREIASSNLNVIFWCHNYVYADFCRYAVRTPQVKCCVFVGKQQYDRYIDNDIIKKSITIFNMFNDTCITDRENDRRTVVFMGALVRSKGFHELCRIWPGILKEVPEAKLKVIGSGRLYGDSQLGRYGIADETYENCFMPFITDERGQIIPSVDFLGIQGAEKVNTFLKSSVGVVNPTAKSETFGMGVVEMAAAQLPVVTIGKNGYFDTVENGKTGILCSSLVKIQENIIRLLKDTQLNQQLGIDAKKYIAKFSPRVIVPLWKKLIEQVHTDNLQIEYEPVNSPFSNNLKWLRCILRFLRFKLHLSWLPSLIDCEYLYVLVRKYISKHK